MDHNSASTAESQKEKILPLSTSLALCSPVQCTSYAEPTPVLQTRRVLPNEILCDNLPRDTTYQSIAQEPGNVAAALVMLLWPENTGHRYVMFFCYLHSLAAVTRNSSMSFICHRKHRASGTAPTTPQQLLLSAGLTSPNISPETKPSESGQESSSFQPARLYQKAKGLQSSVLSSN